MKVEYAKQLYVYNGFFWNDQLSEFYSEYGGKEIVYRHHITGTEEIARFLPAPFISCGRRNGTYETIVRWLGEEIAPVGECNRGHIELLLTQSGKLIGNADYLLLRWGDEASNWKSSVSALLSGTAPVKIGVVD